MTITIQPLDSQANPTDKAFTEDWDAFVEANEFDAQTLLDIQAAFAIGASYLIGGGAAGGFRISEAKAPLS